MNFIRNFGRWLAGESGPADPNLGRERDSPGAPDLFALLNAAWMAQAVYVATRLGVADHLRGGPKPIAELARCVGADEHRMFQLLRALAAQGIFAIDESGLCHLTPAAGPLVQEGGSWLRLYALVWGEQLCPAFGRLLEMVRSGESAFQRAHGMAAYNYYRSQEEAGKLFVDFMNAVTDWQRDIIIGAFDFRPYRHVVDVGGGRASLITGILKAHAHLRGTIFDQPHMADEVRRRIGQEGLADRCSFVGGSFLESVPAGGDLYLVKHVLFDWPDAEATRIVQSIATAMRPPARLVIIDGLVGGDASTDWLLKARDLEQMVWNGGKLRTREEFGAMLRAAGLRLVEIRPTAIPDGWLIIAEKGDGAN